MNSYYFEIEYDIAIGKVKDVEGVNINIYPATYEVLGDDVYFEYSEYCDFFYDNQQVSDMLYLDRFKVLYDYIPNIKFEEFQYYNLDIDDYGDNDEGWDMYLHDCELERERVDNSIGKMKYAGLILTDNETVMNDIINQVKDMYMKEL